MAIGLSKDRLGTIIENELTIGMSPEERRSTRKLAEAIAVAIESNNRELESRLRAAGLEL
jgi:hypothetical protein